MMHGETGRGNGTNDEHMVHNFPTACINWNERTSSNCSPKFPTEIHGKLITVPLSFQPKFAGFLVKWSTPR